MREAILRFGQDDDAVSIRVQSQNHPTVLPPDRPTA
jgi:hypothetical protein